MIDPRVAYHLGASALRSLVPRADVSEQYEIRRQFAQYLGTAAGRRCGTWQEAWNALTGAREHLPGEIVIVRRRCSGCRGRRLNPRTVSRNLARTGSPHVCGQCRGTGTEGPVRFATRFARTPG